jgi:hypothetical protein
MSSAVDEVSRQLFEYAIASDTKDWRRLADLFAYGKYFFAKDEGSQAVIQWGETVPRAETATQHAVSTIAILEDTDIDAGFIHATNYLTLFAQDSAGQAHTVSACWFDSTWEKVDGHWRWRTHKIVPIFRGDWTLIHKTQQFPHGA